MSVRQGSASGVTVNPKAVLLLTAGATFMAFLDVTVVNIAFPALRESFPDTPITDLTWIVSGFGVAFAALLTPAGRLADVIGRRRVFVASLALFTASSALCAVATGYEMLLIARIIQGIAAAGMIPAALGLVLASTPAEHRAAAVGVWGAAGSMAAAAGPSLGGVLIELTSWRAVFIINIPIGLLLILGALRQIPSQAPTGERRPDPLGTIAVMLGVGALVLGLTKGGDWGWTDPRTLVPIIGGVVAIAAAVLRSRRHPAPAIETGLWRNRTFAVANLTSLFAGAALYSWLLAGPLYLTTHWGYSELEAGLAVTPGALTSAVAAIAVGKRGKPKQQLTAIVGGMVVFAAVAVWMWLGLGTSPQFLAIWLPAGLISGAAVGATLTGLSTAAALSVPPARFAAGTALNTTARQVGGSLGVAAMAAIATAYTGTMALRGTFFFAAVAAVVAAVVGIALLPRTREAPPAAAQPEPRVARPQQVGG